MVVYFIMIIMSLFWCMNYYYSKRVIHNINYSRSKKNDGKIFFLLMAFLPLWIVAGVRYGIGADYFAYRDMFINICQGNMERKIEIGYFLLNSIISIFTENPTWLFMIVSFITIFLICKVIFDESDDVVMSIFLFVSLGFYFYAFNAIRQYISIAISLLSYKYIREKHFRKFMLIILIAALFHKSVIVMIPMYFILSKRFKIKQYMIFFLVSIGLIPIGEKIKNIIVQVFYPIYWGSFRMKYFDFVFSTINIVIAILVIGGCIFYYKKIIDKDNKNIIYINLSYIMLILSIGIPWLGEMGVRLSHYFMITSILVIPKIISTEKNPYIRLIYRGMIYIIFTVFFIRMLYMSKDSINYLIPYISVFGVN